MTTVFYTSVYGATREYAMIDAYDHDVDRVDFAELAPIVEWARAHGA